MQSRADKIFIALIGLGLLSIYVGAVSMFLWLGLMLVRLFFLNRLELGLFSLMFGSSIFGRLFASDMLVVVLTTGFLILGFVILRKEILLTIVQNKTSYIVFTLLLFYFVVMYLLGPMNSYATGKIARLVVRGITWLLMFQIYVQSKNVNNNHFAILFGLLAIFYLSQAYVIYGVHPNGLLDVSFFRDISEKVGRDDTNTLMVNPHTLGYLSVGAFVFFISPKNISIKFWEFILAVIFLFIVIISGARQTIIAFVGIISCRILLNEGNVIKNVVITIACLLILGIAILNMGLSSIEKSMSGSTAGEMLNRDLDTPFIVMAIDPVFGVGFGGYPEYANKTYPHNMLLEIFSEYGLIGSIIISIFLTFTLTTQKIHIKYKTINNSYFILFLIMFLFSSMISGDLSSSIILFTILNSFVDLNTKSKIR